MVHVQNAASSPELPLIVLNNKADLEDHSDNEIVKSELSLNQLQRPWHILATSAKSGVGIADSLNWITNQLKQKN